MINKLVFFEFQKSLYRQNNRPAMLLSLRRKQRNIIAIESFLIWVMAHQEIQYIIKKKNWYKMMDATAIIDAFSPSCLPYGLIFIPHCSFTYSPCFPMFIPQGPPSQTATSDNVSKDQNELFRSKISHNIVLMNQDFSENKETCVFQKQPNSQDPSAKSNNRNRRRIKLDLPHFDQLQSKPKDSRQKENRNIFSNLLRIFMRNLLEDGTYEKLINSIIQRRNFSFSAEDFYRWLFSFKISFKNYIRFKQLSKLFSCELTADYQTIFLVVIRYFVNHQCPSHCLTSRKINGAGRRMHIEGARSLRHALTQLAFIRKLES